MGEKGSGISNFLLLLLEVAVASVVEEMLIPHVTEEEDLVAPEELLTAVYVPSLGDCC